MSLIISDILKIAPIWPLNLYYIFYIFFPRWTGQILESVIKIVGGSLEFH